MAVGDKVAVHYVHLSPNGKINSTPNAKLNSGGGVYGVACCPDSAPPKHYSNEPVAVTCELCMETDVFKEDLAVASSGKHGQSEADKAITAHRLKKLNQEEAARADELSKSLKPTLDAEAEASIASLTASE